MTENEIGKVVVDAAITLHKELGSGLLETVYEVILARELERRGLKVQRQVKIPIEFDGIKINASASFKRWSEEKRIVNNNSSL